MSQNKQRYTCVSKPGEYELVGTSSGAGTMKGFPVMVYRDVASGRLFHREPENFMARMKKIPAEQAGVNAELLEALRRLMANNCPLTGNPTHEQLVEFWEYEKTQGRGEADDQLFALAVLAKAKGEAV